MPAATFPLAHIPAVGREAPGSEAWARISSTAESRHQPSQLLQWVAKPQHSPRLHKLTHSSPTEALAPIEIQESVDSLVNYGVHRGASGRKDLRKTKPSVTSLNAKSFHRSLGIPLRPLLEVSLHN